MHTASLLMFLTFPCITQLLEQPPQLAVLAQERGTAGLPGSEALRAGPWAALQALSLTVALGIPLGTVASGRRLYLCHTTAAGSLCDWENPTHGSRC